MRFVDIGSCIFKEIAYIKDIVGNENKGKERKIIVICGADETAKESQFCTYLFYIGQLRLWKRALHKHLYNGKLKGFQKDA